MKKPHLQLLILITAIFAAFTLGLFIGRSEHESPVSIHVSASMQTVPPETTLPTESTVETTPAIVFPININTASLYELEALTGIGEVIANRILDYREEHGAFTAPEELLNVEGIGKKRLENILDEITIGG